jgi:hydrophobe/amphiphile efflux-1 (HAE1) family protein
VSVSSPFIRRPVATTLLTAAIALSGIIAFNMLPVSPLPQVDFPTISVNAGLPGASPEVMATSVATPLEKQFTRIAGVTEMTSSSGLGSCSVTLQFELNRDINAAARDVQAAINAAHAYLPANLPMNPNYRKINPSESPIMIMSLTSDVNTKAQMYDVASSIFAQKLSQIPGVGQVFVGGSSLPAVRVELNPQPVNNYGLSLDTIASFLSNANANRPKGELISGDYAMQMQTTDQLLDASQYQNLIVTYRNRAPIRLSDLGRVVDSVEDLRNMGLANGKPSILIIVNRQPNANIIDTVDRIKVVLPQFEAALPPTIHLRVDNDRTTTIRASVSDVERTMLISIALVILVVFAFLRNGWATFIPSVSVPISLIGTFGIMYLLGYSLDNLSLMALTISTGFVVDDAIVVIENITRLLENGEPPMKAALQGAAEIGFTVVSMSTSLIAVFIPILLMGGIVGRLFREFAMTLSIAIMVSMCVSLTTTPMMCARLLKVNHNHGWLYRMSEKFFNWVLENYASALRVILNHPAITMLVMLATLALNVYLYIAVPKGFFPEQDTGRMMGSILGDQSISFQAMVPKLRFFLDQVMADPAIDSVDAFAGGGGRGGGGTNTASMFIQLKPLEERKASADEVIARIRRKTSGVPGATLFLQASQDIHVGGRSSNALYQFTLSTQDLQLLSEWAPKVLAKLRTLPELADVSSDQQNAGLSANVAVDRDTAARLGMTVASVDTALYSAFGQRQVSTMYKSINQYHVIMEVAPEYWQDPSTLSKIYVTTTSGAKVPLSSFTRFSPGTTPLSIPHQGQFPAVTISFNLRNNVSLGQAVDAISSAEVEMGMPATIVGKFAGTAQAYQDSLANEPVLIATALIAVYIVLGMLYESLIHPLTILSTLPSAGVGALIALILCHTELTVIALIGIILLIGLVKKNAILMIDFALAAERNEGKNSREAIYEACILRFRPIMMTTMAALFGGLPLALGTGTGSELRRPLGIAIVGGLIVSQALTLFTTPVIYLFLDRLRKHAANVRPGRRRPGILIPGGAAESAD